MELIYKFLTLNPWGNSNQLHLEEVGTMIRYENLPEEIVNIKLK